MTEQDRKKFNNMNCWSNITTNTDNLVPMHITENNNQLYIDNIPVEWFNERGGIYNLRWYRIICHLQKRMKIRFRLKNKAKSVGKIL